MGGTRNARLPYLQLCACCAHYPGIRIGAPLGRGGETAKAGREGLLCATLQPQYVTQVSVLDTCAHRFIDAMDALILMCFIEP